MAVNLASKVIMVTGGTSGMGRAVARRAASEGAAVVVAGRRADAGESLAGEIQAAGGRALFAAADVTVEDEVAGLVRTAVERFGRLDGAFNNAGGVNVSATVDRIDAAEWHADLEQNLTSVFYGLKYQVPAIAATGGGAIINNASTAAAVFGVRSTTIARWAREGKLTSLLTPDGHRRYSPADVREVLGSAGLPGGEPNEDQAMAEDAARLYEQGWTIRQVAARFECSYGVMRRILKSRVTLRTRGGLPPRPPAPNGRF